MASIPDLSGYVRDALEVELPEFTPRPSTISGSPAESAVVLYQDAHLEVGVWECTPAGHSFVGVIVYGRGASMSLGDAYGCSSLEVCELVRVALSPGRHVPTSRPLGYSLRLLSRMNPGLRLVVSFADPAQGHVGTLYQATNWIFAGVTAEAPMFLYRGRWCHLREVAFGAFGKGGAVAGFRDLPQRTAPPKYRYLYPFASGLRRELVERFADLPYFVASIGNE